MEHIMSILNLGCEDVERALKHCNNLAQLRSAGELHQDEINKSFEPTIALLSSKTPTQGKEIQGIQ